MREVAQQQVASQTAHKTGVVGAGHVILCRGTLSYAALPRGAAIVALQALVADGSVYIRQQ
jgi:hypothetical protein